MGWIKKILLLLVLTVTGLLIPYIWYRIFKKFGKIYWNYILFPALYLWYLLLFRIPLFLLVQYPLHLLGVATTKLSQLFKAVETFILDHRKGIGVFYGLMFLVVFYLVPTEALTQFESATAATTTTVLIAALSFGLTVLAVLLYNLASSISLAQGSLSIDTQKLPGVAVAAGAKEGARSAVEKGRAAADKAVGGAKKADRAMKRAEDTAEKGQKLYRDIETAEDVGSELVSSQVMRSANGQVMKSLMSGLGAISGEGVLIGVVGGAILLVAMFIYALVLSVLTFVVIGLIVGPAYLYLINIIGSVIISPLLGGAKVAGAYGNLIGTQFLNQYTVGIGEIAAVEQTGAMVSQTAAKLGCIAKGPACFRQWQLNNTQRPGSEDVGEQYGLKIERLQVGQGKNLDVAYKDANYAIPISFTLSNPRHGLKGLNAENVSYRMVVRDAEKTYCNTGWQPVDAYTIRTPPDGTVDEGDRWYGNDIYPGTSASTGFQTISENKHGDPFTLKGCKMLQPALGGYKTVMLEVRYNYFSQSTLYFQAMSLQNLQSNPDIEKSMRKSKTADTPVKASINVNSPVLYDQKELNSVTGSDQSASQPFAVRASLDTEEYDLRYKVRELKIRNSQETTRYKDESSECKFRGFGDGLLDLKRSAKKTIIDKAAPNQDLWFTRSAKPPIFGCVMVLENPNDISPTGETLTMGVEAEYTVALEKKIGGFKVYNSRCGGKYDCPMLVTRYYAEKLDRINYGSESWMTKCTGIDAGNGCSVVKGPESETRWDKELLTGGSKLDRQLERGETAYDPIALKQRFPGYMIGPALRAGDTMDSATYDKREYAVGLMKRDYEELIKSGRSFVMYSSPNRNGDIELSEIDGICSNGQVTRKEKIEKVRNWMDRRARDFADVAAFRVKPSQKAC
ncbi:MAG: hypothetical protein ABEJ91_02785 [Candidatus Nanohaloarchaea archaeon]